MLWSWKGPFLNGERGSWTQKLLLLWVDGFFGRCRLLRSLQLADFGTFCSFLWLHDSNSLGRLSNRLFHFLCCRFSCRRLRLFCGCRFLFLGSWRCWLHFFSNWFLGHNGFLGFGLDNSQLEMTRGAGAGGLNNCTVGDGGLQEFPDKRGQFGGIYLVIGS